MAASWVFLFFLLVSGGGGGGGGGGGAQADRRAEGRGSSGCAWCRRRGAGSRRRGAGSCSRLGGPAGQRDDLTQAAPERQNGAGRAGGRAEWGAGGCVWGMGRDGCERARGERGAADSGRPMTTGVCAGWCHAREGGKVHGGRAGAELVVAMISGRAVRGRAAGEEEAYKTHDGRRQGRVPAAQQERRRSAHKML